MRAIISTLFILFSIISISQTNCDCYERLEGLAELQSYEGNHHEALKTYKRALSFLPDSAKYYRHDLELSLYYLNNADLDSAAKYLIKSIEQGYIVDLNYNFRFDSLRASTHWVTINATNRKPNQNFNWNLYNSLQGLRGIDQSIRSKNGIGILARDSLTRVKYYTIVDSIVFDKVLEIINLYGYPRQISHGFNEDYALYFLHSSMYSEEKFQLILKHMRKQHDLCICHLGNIAFLKDRRLDWFHHKKQVAGTWNYPGEFLPIEDLSVVDSIRFQYNLLNLDDWGRITGKVIPTNYIKHDYPENYFCETKNSVK